MTGALDDNLEQRLVGLTAWPGGKTEVWRRALKAPGAQAEQSGWDRVMHRPLSSKFVAGIAAVLILMVAAALTMPHLAATGARTESLRSGAKPASGVPASVPEMPAESRTPAFDGFDSTVSYHVLCSQGSSLQSQTTVASTPPVPAKLDDKQPASALQRHVIRKATIELKTDDVRAVFLKAAMVLNEARGEYVESSELTGTGKDAQAHLTLRVTAERLDDVLNQLRQLGEVRSERVEGQDVTAQVVDVEARLRNEQRVEAELLQLLEKRQDAPLKEILELRDKIGQIRGEIERLTAQRDQLSRLVSLATVLILIRPSDAPVAGESHLGAYFARKCKIAWTDGVQFLADTMATLLSILIGGLVWWVVAIVVVVVVYRRWGRKAPTA